jgi:putative ABC transport system permease protein
VNRARIIRENIRYYRRYYKLIALATVITVAVITGSLMVGESVRATLVQRVEERLGDTETILFSRYAFFDKALADEPVFEGKARAALISNGFISDAGRLIPVMVWGMDSLDIPAGSARLNPALASELSLTNGEAIVLRLPATGLIPSGSLFVTDNYTTSARLTYQGIQVIADGGNLNLKNEQTIPFNVFISRTELADLLGVEGKVNILLSPAQISEDDIAEVWTPARSGIEIWERDSFNEIISDRVFIQEEAVETICRNNPEANRLFSYLVNEMETSGGSIPYSFVTAMDSYNGVALKEQDIILPDYSANRLHAQLNDRIRLTYYYTTDNLKTLYTDTLWGRVAAIVPLTDLAADSTLSAEFPGLSDVERCTDWDSDLPLDMSLITQEDEDYWTKYRTTPKAILSYAAIQKRWSNAYGSATAIRISATPDMKGLDAGMFGLQLIYPRKTALDAARGGVDFASLFLSLGFFIILSAILLLLVPLSEMLFRRRNELTLLKAFGYPDKRIIRLLWSESAPIILAASFIGVIAGVLYTWLTLLLLGTLWQGATHTSGFILFPSFLTIGTGWIIGTAISLIAIPLGIRRTLKPKVSNQTCRDMGVGSFPSRMGAILLLILTLGVMAMGGLWIHSTVLFVLAGVLLIVAAALWGNYWMKSRGAASLSPFNEGRLIGAGLLANKRRVLLSFFTLTAGVFIVFSVGLNRQGFADPSQLLTGTGGYTLWCESNIPVYHNLSTSEGKSKLALNDLPAGAEILQISRYGADDASCLNLNKVTQPTVLGVDMQAVENSSFHIRQTIYHDPKDVFNSLQLATDSVYPVLVDETVLLWTLMRSLGDTIRYQADGRTVYLQIAGTLDNSIFQGNLIMDKSLFSELWPEIAGSEIILFRLDEQETAATARLIEQALNEYGVRLTTTAQRLQAFNSVTDTYLTIFLTLGGLGLLLGIASFVIVVRKDLASRREDILLYRSLGFTDAKIGKLLTAENRLVPLYAVIVGVAGSVAGVSGGLQSVGLWIWILSAILAWCLVLCVVLFIRQSVRSCLQTN